MTLGFSSSVNMRDRPLWNAPCQGVGVADLRGMKQRWMLAAALGFAATLIAHGAKLGDPAKPLSLVKTEKETPHELAARKCKQE